MEDAGEKIGMIHGRLLSLENQFDRTNDKLDSLALKLDAVAITLAKNEGADRSNGKMIHCTISIVSALAAVGAWAQPAISILWHNH